MGDVERCMLKGKRWKLGGCLKSRAPLNFFCLNKNFYGFALPVSREHIQKLKSLNIGLIVTLISEPLRNGRNVNHNHDNVDDPEWHDCDEDMFEDTDDIRFLHLPVSDGYPPTGDTMRAFLTEAKATIDAGKAVGVHCWSGRGRTSTMIAGYLRFYEGLTGEEAIAELEKQIIRLTSPHQRNYLLSPAFPDNLEEKDQPDPRKVFAPDTASCFWRPMVRRRGKSFSHHHPPFVFPDLSSSADAFAFVLPDEEGENSAKANFDELSSSWT